MSAPIAFAPKPAEAVTVRALAEIVGRHHTNVIRDLKKRGYRVFAVRTTSGQVNHCLTHEDVERYLAERRAEGLQTAARFSGCIE